MQIIKIARILLFLALPMIASSQVLQIGNNCHFKMVGNVKMVLRNAGIINNGNFDAGASRITFTGNQNVRVGGTGPLLFNDVTVGKTDGKALVLESGIGIRGILNFASGFVTLSNRNNLDLGLTGSIENERNGSRITGSTGGVVSVRRTVNTPSITFNPGNIGVEITINKDFGTYGVLVQRWNMSIPTGDSLTAIRRRFDVFLPPVDLNGTIKFHYFNSDLNGANESALSLFKLVPFNLVPVTTIVDTAANTLTATGLFDFGSFIAASPNELASLRRSDHMISNTDAGSLVAFPNPVRDRFTLQLTSKQEKNITLRLLDQSGRILQQKQVAARTGQNIFTWDVRLYPAGLYYISSENGEIKNVPFIKQ